ncbi:DNA topoisomerase 2 [Mortierella sp. NVP85]|nr:DNA topoisomerase 2 [Mortierella sp. NVP85]
MAGFAEIGCDNYDVLPLRGKLLSVRDALTQNVLDNKEIGYIKQIRGLKRKHEFITPIVRPTKGNEKLTIPEFEAWKEANDGGRGWTTKYFKGFGTNMNKDAKEYFENMNKQEFSSSDGRSSGTYRHGIQEEED